MNLRSVYRLTLSSKGAKRDIPKDSALLNQNLTTMRKFLIFALIASAVVLSSCNVTRTITNESQYYQRGDTSVVIQTRTVETYDASKK